jgi:ATP-dependent DNA helicase RecQ
MITSSDRAYREKIDRSRRALDPLLKVARERFGVSYLYPIQRFVVSNTLESRPQIVVLPTGSGKSLCFQLPALLLPGPTLVLMPLLSLLADQLRAMLEAGVPVGALRGGLSTEEKASLFEGIRSGRIRLVLATPEACLAEANMPRLAECGFSHLVVDEAHCVSEWGDTFRPAYREVGIIAVKLSIPMVSAFTATASEAVIARIRSLLFGDGDVRIVAGSADRPNISYSVLPVLSIGHALGELLRTAARPLLIFCRTRNGAEISARDALRRFPDIPTRFYHAGLTRDERADVEKWYLHSKDGALFATCAYGIP